ncbi:glycoside hydrolase family 19 protein [Polyangium jinanense]|uniref:Serine protease n=1 Tax=Polyangium jinanense TaxID=2829994 RepID=A0A9X4AUF3_9BACT|nr:glycoside hydrolase family 19 protein [Polyangium jinanense]MDC3958811.1 carboxypeptidase regulatory-like domain-containing protein [Polyangium jinanense]MDC3985208.1 carboxypeptidase regulatory-like domain-containing protein [Polyangium jinanense]
MRRGAQNPFTITLLDVGAEQYGDAVLCRFGTVSVLIDGAHPGNARRKGGHLAIQEQLRPLLPTRGDASQVTLLLISHAHQDHIGCLPRLVRDGHLVAEWALVPDPDLAWGSTTRETGTEASKAALRIAEALREEPLEGESPAEESAFIESAQSLETEYREMLETLTRNGTRVLHFKGSDDPALRPLVEALAEGGVTLKILGPSGRHVAACAEGIAGNLDALRTEIQRALEVAAPGGSEESGEARELSVYRRYAESFAAEREEPEGTEAAGMPRVSNFVNLQSSVLLLEYREKKLLFTGDMQLADPQTKDRTILAGMRALTKAIREHSPYDFVKLSHHGSHNGISAELVDIMGHPPLLGVCAGEKSRRHPHPETLELMKTVVAERRGRWARTDVNGLSTISFDTDEPTVAVSCGRINDASPPRGPSRRRRRSTSAEAGSARRSRGESIVSGPCVAPARGEESASIKEGGSIMNERRASANEAGRVTGGHESHASERERRSCTGSTEAAAVERPASLLEYVPGYQRPRALDAAATSPPDKFLLPPRLAGSGAPVLQSIDADADAPREATEASRMHAVQGPQFIVIGPDDRVRVPRPEDAPYRAICALRITGVNGGLYVGTGWLIDPRIVVTAGHCVYDCDAMGGWASSIEVIPALDGARRPFGSVVSKRFRLVSGWLEDQSSEYDYGVILLDKPVQLNEGFFVPEVLSTAELKGAQVNIAGYPTDRDAATRMYYQARALKGIGARIVQYDIDTFRGQSGAPVWLTRPDGTRAVIAIHTSGPYGNVLLNSGVRITADVLASLRQWAQEAKPARLSGRRRGFLAAKADLAVESGLVPSPAMPVQEIVGNVVDEKNRPLAGATVTISRRGAPTIATTSAQDGSFSLPVVHPGRHTLKAHSSDGTAVMAVTREQASPVALVLASQAEIPAKNTEAGVAKPAGALVKAVQAAPAKKGTTRGRLTLAELRAIMPNLSAARARKCLPHLNKAMKEFGINTKKRMAAFLAQLAHESGELVYFEELASGDAYEGRKDLGNTRPGDGRRYKGRGPIQITGRSNYRAAGKALRIDLEKNPKLAARIHVGFRIAGWYWKTRKLNALADRGDFKKITYRINGGYRGLSRRTVYYRRALRVLA